MLHNPLATSAACVSLPPLDWPGNPHTGFFGPFVTVVEVHALVAIVRSLTFFILFRSSFRFLCFSHQWWSLTKGFSRLDLCIPVRDNFLHQSHGVPYFTLICHAIVLAIEAQLVVTVLEQLRLLGQLERLKPVRSRCDGKSKDAFCTQLVKGKERTQVKRKSLSSSPGCCVSQAPR